MRGLLFLEYSFNTCSYFIYWILFLVYVTTNEWCRWYEGILIWSIKARVTDPNGKDKKITFADVAGNEEAKQELLIL
jgi:ATP-dependent Zn protease